MSVPQGPASSLHGTFFQVHDAASCVCVRSISFFVGSHGKTDLFLCVDLNVAVTGPGPTRYPGVSILEELFLSTSGSCSLRISWMRDCPASPTLALNPVSGGRAHCSRGLATVTVTTVLL